MTDAPNDGPKRSLEDEIRHSVEERIRRRVQRATDRASRRVYRRPLRPPGMFVGLIILALGVIFLLDQQGVVPAHIAFRYFWGFVLMAWGIEIVFAARHEHSWFWGMLLIIVGAGSLVTELGVFHFWLASFWPMLLIALGVMLILQRMGIIPPGGPFHYRDWNLPRPPAGPGVPGASGAPGTPGSMGVPVEPAAPSAPAPPSTSAPYSAPNYPPPESGAPGAPDPTARGFVSGFASSVDSDSGYTDSQFSQVAILSGFKRRVTSQQFRFANLSAVLGGFEIDLRRADIDGEEAIIHVSCVLGGGEIRIPDTWKVLVETDTVGGGFSDETYLRPADPTRAAKRLVIRGTLVFGGIVIKN